MSMDRVNGVVDAQVLPPHGQRIQLNSEPQHRSPSRAPRAPALLPSREEAGVYHQRLSPDISGGHPYWEKHDGETGGYSSRRHSLPESGNRNIGSFKVCGSVPRNQLYKSKITGF